MPDLPKFEDEAVVTEGRGVGSSHTLLVASIACSREWTVSASTTSSCSASATGRTSSSTSSAEAFPDIEDGRSPGWSPASTSSSFAQTGAETPRRWRSTSGSATRAERPGKAELRAAPGGSEAGAWLADYESKYPWFNFSNGNGLLPPPPLVDRRPDNPDRGARLLHRAPPGRRGHRPPHEAVRAERDRITAEYRELLPRRARRVRPEPAPREIVFPYVENHAFYIEHWYLTISWNKVREFGALLAANGFFADGEDVFFLRHHEVSAALDDLRLAWAAARRPPRAGHWPPIVERRKEI